MAENEGPLADERVSMATTGRSRRSARTVRLRSTAPLERSAGPIDSPEPVLGWIPAAIGGGLVAALATWVLVAGLTVVGWLPGEEGDLGAAIGLGTAFWHLGHGGVIAVGATRWSLVPLGITVVALVTVRGAASFAGRQALLADLAADVVPDRTTRARTAARVGGLLAGSYVVPVLVSAAAIGDADLLRLAGGTIVIAASAAAFGVVQGIQLDVLGLLPAWARPIPRAVLAAQLAVVAGAAAALTTSLVLNLERVDGLARQLGGGASATVALTALQVAFLPTLLVWAAAWTLGPGFSVGLATIVSPANTQLGLLPAVPIAGALPPEGPGQPTDLLWLLVGVAAGAVAAATVVRARPRARFDETALVGGLSGALAGLVFTGIAVLARGDLGANRLTELGPRLLELLVTAPALLGLSGLAVGLVWGLVRRPVRSVT